MSEFFGPGRLAAGFVGLLAVALFAACGEGGGEPAAPVKNVIDLDIKAFAAEVRADLAEDGRLDSFLIFDARLPKEFEIRSIPGAISLPFAGAPLQPGKQFFTNPATGLTEIAALTLPDGSPIQKGRRMIFYSGRSG